MQNHVQLKLFHHVTEGSTVPSLKSGQLVLKIQHFANESTLAMINSVGKCIVTFPWATV